jgi:hypothetical protein
MHELQDCVKYLRKSIHNAHMIKVIPIVVVLDADGELIHNHMEHPSPITRPQLIKILANLHEQVAKDYNNLKKTAADPKEAERILHCLSGPIP